MRSLSFRGRLALAMGTLILLLSAVMYIYLPRKLEEEAIALMSHKAETLAELTAFTIHPSIYFADRAALEEALSGTRRDKDVAYLIVTDAAGKRLASVHPERATGARGVSRDRSLYELVTPIRDGKREMARLYVGMSLSRLNRELARMRVAISLLSLFVLAIGLLAVALIGNVLTRLRELSKRLLSVQEQERVRISREVHDELGPSLTAMKIDLQQLGTRHPELEEPLAAVTRNIDEIVDLVRRIATDLRPAILDDLGVPAALEQQLRRLRESTGIQTTLTVSDEEPELDMLTSVTLYRIAQEALANVVRHASASVVEVSLDIREGWAVLVIRDNGRGMERETVDNRKSLGLLGIRERAELLGGSVAMDSRPGKGTVLTVTLPLAEGDRNLENPLR